MPIKKIKNSVIRIENIAEVALSNPRKRAPVIVPPALLAPGIKAKTTTVEPSPTIGALRPESARVETFGAFTRILILSN